MSEDQNIERQKSEGEEIKEEGGSLHAGEASTKSEGSQMVEAEKGSSQQLQQQTINSN